MFEHTPFLVKILYFHKFGTIPLKYSSPVVHLLRKVINKAE